MLTMTRSRVSSLAVVAIEHEQLADIIRVVASGKWVYEGRTMEAGGDYTSEINPAAEALVADVGACLIGGSLLVIDYGFPQAEFYHPQRGAGTLMHR